MTYTLRPYQQEAVTRAIEYLRKNSEPALLDLCTGGGKSLIVADIARILVPMSKKKVLCLCPTSELVEQNYEKYLLTGNDASIYSASIGKSLRHDVVFATEGTFKSVASEQGQYFSTVIIDEAHRITPTIQKIIDEMRLCNPNLRVLGLTATPYRLGTGYIYTIDQHNNLVPPDECINPYFRKLLYRVTTQELIDQKFLTPVRIGKIGAKEYDTSKLQTKSNGQFTQESLDEAFVGQGRKTADIVADVVNQSNAMQAKGVMFFAATVDHAYEIMESLPAYNSALVTGATPKKERKQIIKDFKAKKIKYLVNVSVLTTGFDAPHCSVVAVLRRTESASLLQQIIGRVLRLDDGKEFALYLDYADNINTFFPDGDLFNPKITASKSKEGVRYEIQCPQCNNTNNVAMRPNPDGYDVDQFGYFADATGERIEYEGQHFPAHFSRRCSHIETRGKNVFERCDYYWSYKECPECSHKNDLTARKCESCNHEMINPNEKLIAEFQAMKKDLSQVQTDEVTFIRKKRTRSKAGGDMIQISFGTKFRIVQAYFSEKVQRNFYELFLNDPRYEPKTITYKKSSSGYMHIYDFNRETDEQILQRKLGKTA